jgi:hypothetical protein
MIPIHNYYKQIFFHSSFSLSLAVYHMKMITENLKLYYFLYIESMRDTNEEDLGKLSLFVLSCL